jgi:hypothetical protein
LSKGAQLDPSLLASIPQLGTLELDFCNILRPHGAFGADHEFTFDQTGTGTYSEATAEFKCACVAVAQLFEQVSSLTRLESLSLSNIWGLKVQPVQSFAALAASSSLTALRFQVQEASLDSDRISPEGEAIGVHFDMPLRPGALQHMFPAGKQLPQLQLLRIVYTGSTIIGMSGNLEQEDIYKPTPFKVSASELAAIRAACPALKDLQIQLT